MEQHIEKPLAKAHETRRYHTSAARTVILPSISAQPSIVVTCSFGWNMPGACRVRQQSALLRLHLPLVLPHRCNFREYTSVTLEKRKPLPEFE